MTNPEIRTNSLLRDIELKFKHKKWNILRKIIEKNKDIVNYDAFSRRSMLFMCYQSNETPMHLIKLIGEAKPEQVQTPCQKHPNHFTALDHRTTILHEGIDNHMDMHKLTYLLELDMGLGNDKSVTKIFNGRKRLPLHSFMRNFSFYSSKKEEVLKFTSMLIKMNPQAIICKDFDGKVPLSCLLSQLNYFCQNVKDDGIWMQVLQLLISVYDSYPRSKNDFMSIMRLGLSEYSPQRLKVISLLIEASQPINKLSLCSFMDMNFEENELEWLVENSSENDLRYQYSSILEFVWARFVDEWNSSLKPYFRRSEFHKSIFFFNRQKACMKAIKKLIKDNQMKKGEQITYENLKKFWTRIHIILGRPNLILHKLCKIQCPEELIEIGILLHPEQISALDENGKLPLHVALANNVCLTNSIASRFENKKATHGDAWTIVIPKGCNEQVKKVTTNTKVELLLQFYPEALREKATDSKLFPFMIAATNSNLNLCYKMLRMAPEIAYYGYQNYMK